LISQFEMFSFKVVLDQSSDRNHQDTARLTNEEKNHVLVLQRTGDSFKVLDSDTRLIVLQNIHSSLS
jgi:hypothetical protein